MAWQPARKLFTVAEYHRMAETGVLKADDRTELINGEIIYMSPIGLRHAAHVDWLNDILPAKLRKSAIVRVQSPIILSNDSERSRIYPCSNGATIFTPAAIQRRLTC